MDVVPSTPQLQHLLAARGGAPLLHPANRWQRSPQCSAVQGLQWYPNGTVEGEEAADGSHYNQTIYFRR